MLNFADFWKPASSDVFSTKETGYDVALSCRWSQVVGFRDWSMKWGLSGSGVSRRWSGGVVELWIGGFWFRVLESVRGLKQRLTGLSV